MLIKHFKLPPLVSADGHLLEHVWPQMFDCLSVWWWGLLSFKIFYGPIKIHTL